MESPLSGVRALEVASHVFVPMAGSVLTEWGAQVVKVEHPVSGDPYRGWSTVGLHKVYRGVDPSSSRPTGASGRWASTSSITEGRDLLAKMMANTDVFLTSFRPGARRRLRIDVEDIRRDNPSTIYVLRHGLRRPGPRRRTAGATTSAPTGRGAACSTW